MSSYTSYSQWRSPSSTNPTASENGNNSNNVLDQGPRAKCDQVIYEALAKAAEVIVHGRSGTMHTPQAMPSSRFNLHVPEHAQVRSILSNYRQSLHVPVRLDVYYQHPPENGMTGKRELLERWCLEYSQVTTERFLEQEGGLVSKDPIVQLRHVCKRIVIWLRTLHCWCRLLPAQALKVAESPNIGFSIYVNSAGQDDVTALQEQGFGWQTPPATVVTPFGELAWKVLYAPPRPVLERLIALHQKQQLRLPIPTTTTAARPIPIQQSSRASDGSGFMVAQSAPAHLVRNDRPSVTTHPGSHAHGQATGYHGQQQQQQHTFDPSRLHQRSQTSLPALSHHNGAASNSPASSSGIQALRRRNTSIGTPEHAAHPAPIHEMPAKDGAPARVMSGLSLAMLMQEDDDDKKNDGESSVSEKRRAALHQMPPHLSSTAHAVASAHANAPASSEYGYAYNSHIPWQKIHPSLTNPSAVGHVHTGSNTPTEQQQQMSFSRRLSSSPDATGTTPSSFALASTPPTGGGAFGLMLSSHHHNLPPGVASGSLLPPRQTPITPPFGARPMGLESPPPMSLHPSNNTDPATSTLHAAPTPALDLLHSSPFHHQGSVLGSTMMKSTGPPSSLEQASSALSASYNLMQQGSVSLHDTYGDILRQHDQDFQDEQEDMPFAVDGMDGFCGSATLNPPTLSSSSTVGASSMAVASLAQQCISSNKLRLFESLQASAAAAEPNDNDMNSLLEQLSEFKSFGASLQLSTTTTTTSSEA